MTVDEILASGRYTDRRGRRWEMCRVAECLRVGDWWGYAGPVITRRHITYDQMRLLIERDQHRDMCPGLYACYDHPVPIVWKGPLSRMWKVDYRSGHSTLPEAMDAARVLAVKV